MQPNQTRQASLSLASSYYATIDLMLQKAAANKQGFSAILIILGIIALLIVLVFVLRVPQQILKVGRSVSRVGGPKCPDGAIFTTIPVGPVKILSVTPLGNLNPPDHTIPTDHIYLVVKNNNNIEPESAAPVYSPGDVSILRISHSKVFKSGRIFSDDYSIDFSPCSDIQAKFGHVTKLSAKLLNVIDQNKGNCDSQNPRPDDTYTVCNYDNINVKLKAGEEIGEAGGGTATGLDFWTIDSRSEELKFANKNRYRSNQLHIVCPVDLFETSQKNILSQKFGGYEKRRTIEPLCGRIDQDIPGTAQGNWTTATGLIDMPEAWSKSLALVHDNTDPEIGVVSIGGIISKGAKIQFAPAQSGTINREFSQIRPDGQIYCYEGRSISPYPGQSGGRVLIQMVNDTSLKVEYQNEPCQQPFNFNSPTLYQR